MTAQTKQTHLGLALRLYMNEFGISLRDLSEQLSIPHTSLHRFIKEGDSISNASFLKLMVWATSRINDGEEQV